MKKLLILILVLLTSGIAYAETYIANTSWANNELKEDIVYKKALDYFESAEYEKTIDVLNKSIEGNPNAGFYHTLIGRAYYGLNKTDKAREHYESAINTDTDNIMAYIGRGIVSDGSEEKIYWFKKAFEKDPAQYFTLSLLVSSYKIYALEKEIQGDSKKAVELNNEAKGIINSYLLAIEESSEPVSQEWQSFRSKVKLQLQEKLKIYDNYKGTSDTR